MKLIKRNIYINELKSLMNTPDVKVITGVRRSGKSKLMDALAEEIMHRDNNAHIIHVNFNLTEYEDLLEYHSLESYIEAQYSSDFNNYVLIDEIQMCEHSGSSQSLLPDSYVAIFFARSSHD